MNKFTPIFWVLILFLSISGCAKPEQAEIGFWKSEDCKKISEAAGFFLYTSGELLKTADKERQAGTRKIPKKHMQQQCFFQSCLRIRQRILRYSARNNNK